MAYFPTVLDFIGLSYFGPQNFLFLLKGNLPQAPHFRGTPYTKWCSNLLHRIKWASHPSNFIYRGAGGPNLSGPMPCFIHLKCWEVCNRSDSFLIYTGISSE